MSLRTRLLLAFAAVVLIPIVLLAFGLRQEMTRRLSDEYQVRVDRVVEVIREDLARESASISERLASLATAILNDNRRRLGARVSARLRGHRHASHWPLDAADSGWRRPDHQLRPFQERARPRRDW